MLSWRHFQGSGTAAFLALCARGEVRTRVPSAERRVFAGFFEDDSRLRGAISFFKKDFVSNKNTKIEGITQVPVVYLESFH